MAEQTGWAEDRTQPPHLLLSTPLGTLRPESVTPAVANGREVVVFSGSDEESLPVRFVDLDSGAPLPDRSLLHSAHLVGLGMGSGRALLATVTLRGTVAVREVGTGEPIGPAIHGPGSPLAVLTGLVGPRELVAVSYRDEIRVWDPAAGAAITVQGFGGPALVVYEGRLLAVTGGRLRDVLTGEAFGMPFPESVVAAVVHRGRALVAAAGVPVRFWDVDTGAETTPGLADGIGEVSRLTLAEVGNGLAAVVTREGGRIELWLPGEDRPTVLEGDAAAVLSHDGRVLTAVAGRSGALSVGGVRSPYYGGPVGSFAGWAKRSGRMLAVLSGDPALLYDIEAGRPFARVPFPGFLESGPVEVTVDGGGFRVHDTVKDRELLRRDGLAVTAVGYREVDDKALLATGDADGSVRLWDVSAREPIGGPWHGHPGPVTAVALARWRGQAVVLSTDASGTARMWRIGGPVRHTAHTERVSALAGGTRAGRAVFASGGEDGTIRFWNPVTAAGAGAAIRSGPVEGLAFAGDILVSSGDGGVRRWDAVTGQPIGEPWPGSSRLATAGALVAVVDGSRLLVWDSATGDQHATMPLPGPDELQDLTVHNGRLLALTVSDEQVTIWDVAAAEPLFPPMLTSDDGGLGTFGRVGGRLVAAHGVDARRDDGIGPEEADDIYLRDVATGELGTSYRPEAGFNQQLLITRARGRDVVLVAAENAVVTWDAATGRAAASPVESRTGSFTCIAAIETDGRTYAAAGDWAGTVRIWEI